MMRTVPSLISCFIALVSILLPAAPAGAAGDILDQSQGRLTPGSFYTLGTIPFINKQYVIG